MGSEVMRVTKMSQGEVLIQTGQGVMFVLSWSSVQAQVKRRLRKDEFLSVCQVEPLELPIDNDVWPFFFFFKIKILLKYS